MSRGFWAGDKTRGSENRAAVMDGGARQVVAIGILTALTVVMTAFTKIPTPVIHGYFNLGDTVVLIAGVLFGDLTGAFVGGVGSAAADILTGSYIFAPITLIVKGLEGYAAGKVMWSGVKHVETRNVVHEGTSNTERGIPRVKPGGRKLMTALAAGAVVMPIGYFIAEAAVLSLFDRAFGIGAAIAEFPLNVAQGGVSVILARVAIEGLKRSRVY